MKGKVERNQHVRLRVLGLSELSSGIPSPHARWPAVTVIALIYNDLALLKQPNLWPQPRGGRRTCPGRGGGGQ
jgi:hypothetical protein